ncbi:MAG: FAD:protein FMN transferase [Pseudomonadota bacterium]
MKLLKISIVIGIVIGIAVLILVSRSRRQEAVFYPMGGIPFKVVAYGRSASEFRDDMEAVKARVAALEHVFSRYDAYSELTKINQAGTVVPIEVSPDLFSILMSSGKWHVLSKGAFDPSVTPLIELWKNAEKTKSLPTDEEVANARKRVGFKYISYTDDGRVLFTKQGMALDFGAIAKGWIADEVAKLLKKRGVKRAIIDAGGNALTFGDGTFTFGIADPRFSGRKELMGTVDVSEGGVVTSGNYERFVTIDGKRYSHIIDPRTGRPVNNGLVAATVIGGTGTDADALATSIMVLGKEGATKLLKQLPECKALLVEKKDGIWHVWASFSLLSRLRLSGMWADNVHTF